uniref:uncharacterized protein LOC122608663 n=1 Tax=Erigeron canadensis TaxID=72917 RepID=UPI001CB96AC3|nr:uncharacterized protein LOC122608663 [Erigeron canadensis]
MFDSALFMRKLDEFIERSKKKTDDPPPGDERHVKAMQLLKEMHKKAKIDWKLLAQEQEKQGGGGINVDKNTTTNINNKDDAALVVGEKPLLLNHLLASRRASALCPNVPLSKKQKNKASLEEFRRQFGPHRTTLTTARNMFLQDVAWSKDFLRRP